MECKESPFESLRWCVEVICTCSHKIILKSYKFTDVENLQEAGLCHESSVAAGSVKKCVVVKLIR